MIWVVDGTRLKRDFSRFKKNQDILRKTSKQGQFTIDYVDECFPSNWANSKVPIIFDFKGYGTNPDSDELRNYLICLMPNQGIRQSVVYFLTRDSFINNIRQGSWFNKKNNTSHYSRRNPVQRPAINRRSPYVLHLGRWVKKRRL